MSDIPKVLSVYGTRPDAIKMAPVALELAGRKELEHIICVTGQHREMLDQVLDLFGIKPEHDLEIMYKRQSLEDIASRVLQTLPSKLDEIKPDIVLVHGDTSTAFISALTSFYKHLLVGHVEAGLRTSALYSPFPEEGNRRLIDTIARLHLAPTENARLALLNEGIDESSVFVTGNTVIDALLYAVEVAKEQPNRYPLYQDGTTSIQIVTITAHRRESWGQDLENIARAVVKLAEMFPDWAFVFPIHMNPNVREAMFPILNVRNNIVLREPLNYLEFVSLMSRSKLILTDSGGIQEEAPSLGIPVLVMRNLTEREEGIDAGCLKLVGTETDHIVAEASKLLSDSNEYDKMSNVGNPYGDGKAAWRIANILKRVLIGPPLTPDEIRNDDKYHFSPKRRHLQI